MDFNKKLIEEIFKTLPISYYLGSKIDADLGKSDCSYFDPVNNKIVVSLSQIRDAIDNINIDLSKYPKEKEEEINEFILRCLLYHEISHVILTHNNIFEKCCIGLKKDIMNIFEDERIETVLRSYFMNVDFKKFVKIVNGWNGPCAKTPIQKFYEIVRFDCGEQKFIDRKNEIIEKYKNIHREQSTNYWWRAKDYNKVEDYVSDVLQLYRDINEEQNEEQQKEPNEELYGVPKGELSKEQNEEQTEELNIEDLLKDLNNENKTFNESKEFIKEIIENLKGSYSNKNFDGIIDRLNHSNKVRHQGGGRASYSGVLNPKLIGRQQVEDYKWWLKNNTNGAYHQYDKIKLNFWCDVSGSFKNNETKINSLLKSLIRLEETNKNFSFDLVKMGDSERIALKNDRSVKCEECNCLSDKVFKIYDRLQPANSTVLNIIVFDGDAYPRDNQNFKAWNHNNCVIISDPANNKYIKRFCKASKNIITNNYYSELEKNLISALNYLIR